MKRLTYKHLVFLLFIFGNFINLSQLEAQNEQLTQKEQKRILKKADTAYQGLKYSTAAGYFESYLQSMPESSNTLLAKLADCYWQTREYNDALRVYKLIFPNVLTENHGATKQQHLRMAELYARFHDYKQASQWLNGIEGYQSKSIGYNEASKLKSMRKDSLNWHLGFLDINTSFRDFSPFIADSILYFSSNRPDLYTNTSLDKPGNNYDRLWKVSVSKLHATPLKMIESVQEGKYNSSGTNDDKGLYSKVNIFPDKLYGRIDTNKIVSMVKGMENIRYNIGAVSIDKNNHFYFSANYPNADRRGINRLRLMEGFLNRRGSMKMKPLPFGDPRLFTVMHPTINKAGTLLVLSSDKPNGKGNFDLYYTQRKSIQQAWNSLKAFGSNINTVGNEVFPTITTNGYLYYSSDALPGLGGLDIFRIPLQDALDGKGKPEHLSYPVNSSGDDFGWTQDTTTVNGYFTSDRLNNNNDIFSFIYKEPVKMLYIENKVVNRETKQPIEGATLFLLNKKDGKVYIAKTDKQGKYDFSIADAEVVIVKVMGKGFASYCLPSDLISISQPSNTVLKTSNYFSLNKLKINYAWKLNIIYYAFDKFELSASDKPVLDTLINILKNQPISIEISSYTDSRGTNEYNYLLSLKRSESVVNYLIKHGVDSYRLIAKGYGETRLINHCADGVPCSEEEYQVNRRTEVKVIDYQVEQKSPLADVDPDQFKDGDVINLKALPLGFFNECDPDAAAQQTQMSKKDDSKKE